MPRVFISYSRKDSDFVRKLNNALQQQGCDTWVDWQDIPRGERWLNQIYQGIENANDIICIISRHSLTSEACNEEIYYAIQRNKRILPLILEPIKDDVFDFVAGRWISVTWEEQARNNWKVLNNLNWLFFTEETQFEVELNTLRQTLETNQPYIEAHTKYLVRALEWNRQGSAPHLLLFGEEIDKAEAWLATTKDNKPQADPLHHSFIEESRSHEMLRQARAIAQAKRTQRLQRASLILVFMVLLAIIATTIAANSANKAEDARQRSEAFRASVEAEATIFAVERQQIEQAIIRFGAVPTHIEYLPAVAILASATAQVNATPFSIEVNSNYGAEMVLVPAGCFLMGSVADGAIPIHEVCFEEAYWIDRYEVTHSQYRECPVCMEVQSAFPIESDQLPITGVNWFNALQYCSWRGVRLPTEAEWEYAARSPSSFAFPWGDTFHPEYAIYIDNADNRPHEIGGRPAASASWVGAFDMSGNVAEWVSTGYATVDPEASEIYLSFFHYPYKHDEREDMERNDVLRVVRGGSFNNEASMIRPANRLWYNPMRTNPLIGFRCAFADSDKPVIPQG